MSLHLGAVTVDCADPQGLARFWTAVLGVEVDADYGEYVFLTKPSEAAAGLGFQRVPEERAGKNRLHLDLMTDDRAAEVDRVVGLGAKEIGEHEVPGLAWTVLEDPEGNVFCIGQHEH
ncbi:VOC family protein [Amycolatopsis anabasis]|uniref:VOC family protein n=1 Tax=Amycolatopsis anabasis TaxID=1840409 RepID=UPI00131BA3A7|nr:VOC family protein [Amycolatopsis anabasis]